MYRAGMPATDPRSYLWTNICQLIGIEEPSLNDVQKRVGVGRGTVQRIKDGDTGTRIDSLAVIATKLGVEVWQLLHPTLGKSGAPLSAGAMEIATLYERLDPAARENLYRLLQSMQQLAAPI